MRNRLLVGILSGRRRRIEIMRNFGRRKSY